MKITKEQATMVVRMIEESDCYYCELLSKHIVGCQCKSDFVATDEFVQKVNKILEDE